MSIGHCCLDLNFSGNMRLGGLRNCIDCKDFSCWMFAKVFLTVNLFSITTVQVSLMCQRFVDFHEPIYHRLLSRFHTFETLFSFLLRFSKNSSNCPCFSKASLEGLSFFHPLAVLLLRWISFLVLVLVINNYCSNIVIHVYRFTNKLLIIYFYND